MAPSDAVNLYRVSHAVRLRELGRRAVVAFSVKVCKEISSAYSQPIHPQDRVGPARSNFRMGVPLMWKQNVVSSSRQQIDQLATAREGTPGAKFGVVDSGVHMESRMGKSPSVASTGVQIVLL